MGLTITVATITRVHLSATYVNITTIVTFIAAALRPSIS